MKNIASYLHLLLCKKKHSNNVNIHNQDPAKCSWYIEEQFDTCWEESEHLQWLAKADTIAKLVNMDEGGMSKMMGRIVSVLQEVKKLKSDYPTIQEFIVEIFQASLKN